MKKKVSGEIIRNEQKLITDIDDLLLKSKNYIPSQIDLSKESFLNDYDINLIFSNQKDDKSKKDLIINLILLKQYLYHLNKSNQGYNLHSMKNGNAKFLIEYFLQSNNIIEESEGFINSAIGYNILKEKQSATNLEILKLISKIDMENKRIIKQSKEIIGN